MRYYYVCNMYLISGPLPPIGSCEMSWSMIAHVTMASPRPAPALRHSSDIPPAPRRTPRPPLLVDSDRPSRLSSVDRLCTKQCDRKLRSCTRPWLRGTDRPEACYPAHLPTRECAGGGLSRVRGLCESLCL